MTWLRRKLFLVLMILSLVTLTGSDVECEDDEFEFDWPDIDVHDDYDGGYWVYEPCCWYW